MDLGLHTQFIGEILDVKADPSVLGADGLPDILKIRPLVFDTAHRGYYGIGPFPGQAFSVGKNEAVMGPDLVLQRIRSVSWHSARQ